MRAGIEAAASTGAYDPLAGHYDRAVGRHYFNALRRAFDVLVPRYGLKFRDALDLGCGTGLFACHLAERYKAKVLGIDNAPAMLAVARRQCQSCRVGFQQQDLRTLALPWRFDLVTANFDTLNHLSSADELRAVLRAIGTLLRPGGHLLFDLLTPAAAACLGPRGVRELRLAQGMVWQRITLGPGARQLVTHMRVVSRGRVDAPMHPRQGRLVERLVSVTEAAHYLHDAGLPLRDVLDAQTLCSATRQPPRALFVAYKPLLAQRAQQFGL
jgi:SAM-dependent methyltransferase